MQSKNFSVNTLTNDIIEISFIKRQYKFVLSFPSE